MKKKKNNNNNIIIHTSSSSRNGNKNEKSEKNTQKPFTWNSGLHTIYRKTGCVYIVHTRTHTHSRSHRKSTQHRHTVINTNKYVETTKRIKWDTIVLLHIWGIQSLNQHFNNEKHKVFLHINFSNWLKIMM